MPSHSVWGSLREGRRGVGMLLIGLGLKSPGFWIRFFMLGAGATGRGKTGSGAKWRGR